MNVAPGWKMNVFGEWVEDVPVASCVAPVHTIPVTDAMRREDVLRRRREDTARASAWTIKSSLRAENVGDSGRKAARMVCSGGCGKPLDGRSFFGRCYQCRMLCKGGCGRHVDARDGSGVCRTCRKASAPLEAGVRGRCSVCGCGVRSNRQGGMCRACYRVSVRKGPARPRAMGVKRAVRA